MKPRLLLHCDSELSAISLTKDSENWRRQFTDLKQALDYAARAIHEETPLIVYNAAGRVIIQSHMPPARPL